MKHLFTFPGVVGSYSDVFRVEQRSAGERRQIVAVMRDGERLVSAEMPEPEFQPAWQAFLQAWDDSLAARGDGKASENVVLEVKKLRPEAKLPVRSSEGASCFDICAADPATLQPGERALVKTGLQMAVPRGYEIQVRSRSGHAAKAGVFVLNSPGTVDSDYRGEVGVILLNTGTAPFSFAAGDRIAQIAVCAVEMCPAVEVQALTDTQRGAGGFGSTGVK